MKSKKIVIIGGNAAGMSAASRIRRNDEEAQIIVLEKTNTVSYAACGLPYFISDDIKQEWDLIARTVEEFRDKANIDVRLQHEAVSLDTRNKTVFILNKPQGASLSLPYDKLLIATGAGAIIPQIPGFDLDNVYAIRTMDDGIQIKKTVETGKLKNAVIVGGGYIGLEMAEALHKQNMQVTIVEMLDRLMKNVDQDISDEIEQEIIKHNCKIIKNNGLQSVSGNESVRQVQLQNGDILKADLVLLCLGIKPAVALAQKSGIQLGRTGAIAVNPRMQTNVPNIYAAGDCAEVKNIVTNKNDYIPLGTTANKQGRIAADNITGKVTAFKGVTATAVVKVLDLEIARTGMTSDQAKKLKADVKSIVIKGFSRAHYYPGHQSLIVKLIFDGLSGQLYGAQIAGREGAAKRIDILATALHQKMTVTQIAELDLSYAPPFAPVWDPVLIAAQQAVKKVRKR